MALSEMLSTWWGAIQGQLFPRLDETVGPVTPTHRDIGFRGPSTLRIGFRGVKSRDPRDRDYLALPPHATGPN